jgi:tetratricopeptide (TPR) repeat protein
MKKINFLKGTFVSIIVILLSGCSGNSSEKFYKEGMKYTDTGNYKEAASSFSKAIELKSDRAEYYIDYGMTLIMLNENKEAILNFDKAILDKENVIVNKNNKRAYRGKGIAYYKSYRYKEAIEEFNKALSLNELSNLDEDILYYKGSAEEKSGLYEDAIQTYTTLADNSPSDDKAYNSRGYAYGKLHEFDKGLADYDKAISLKKKNYNHYLGKYFLLLEADKKEEAHTVLEEAAGIKAETEEDKFNLAKVHYYMEEYDMTINEFSKALESGFEEAYYYLGSIYEKGEKYEEAVNNYQKYIEAENISKTALVYNQIGACLLKLGRYSEALSYIQTGLEYQDKNLEQPLKRNEIAAYEKMKDFVKAYHLMKDYIKVNPDDKEALKEYEFLKTRLPEASSIVQ